MVADIVLFSTNAVLEGESRRVFASVRDMIGMSKESELY